MDKPVADMTLVELCRYHVDTRFNEGKSIRIILDLIENRLFENALLLDDLLTVNAVDSQMWKDIKREEETYHMYKTWAEKQLKGVE
jgi:hypothetical protein